MCSPGAEGLWGGERGTDGGEEANEKAAPLPGPPPLSCPHSSPVAAEVPPPCHLPVPLSSYPPFWLLLPNPSEQQRRNYTLCVYNQCSHVYDLISACHGPGGGGEQVGLSVLVAQVGKWRLREGKGFAPGHISWRKIRMVSLPQIYAHKEGQQGSLPRKGVLSPLLGKGKS